ncbi:MAG: hypothetical protein RLY31_2460 [Bacteroidota bacterium]|jgi:thioredoxin-related protein
MKKSILLTGILTAGVGFLAFTTDSTAPSGPGGIQWLTWEEMVERSRTEERKVVVDVYTEWCGWCKRMDATTFAEQEIARYVNERYYAVKFDAEQRGDLSFKGRNYQFVKNGMRGYHELAAEITQGRLSYPTIVFLDERLEVIQSIPGYRDAGEFETILTYFGENNHRKVPWDTYQRNYRPMQRH